MRFIYSLLALSIIGLLACAGDPPGPTPATITSTPTVAPTPTFTPIPAPTDTIAPTPRPTAVPAPTPMPTPTAPPTAIPAPTTVPIPTLTVVPSPTPTPHPTSTVVPTPTLTPPPSPTPTPALPRLHNTQNTRWLERNYPTLYRRIQMFPWVQDGLSRVEREVIDQLLYFGVGEIGNLEAVLNLPWVQDAVSEREYDVIYRLRGLAYDDAKTVSEVIAMPFLQSLDSTDAHAIRAMDKMEKENSLSALVDSPVYQDGLTEDDTVLVAAVGALAKDADEVRRALNPGVASIETVDAKTDLTPELKVSVVRTDSQSRPGTVEAVVEGVAFVERVMGMPLPTDHVIVVLNDKSVSGGYAGTNYGFAVGYLPKYEQPQDLATWRSFQRGLVHELSHYYWTGNESWVNEGVADTIEYMHGVQNGLSPGQLRNRRGDCEAHDLKMLSEWAPDSSSPRYRCAYFLGQALFRDLLDGLSDAEFGGKLQSLFLLSLQEREGRTNLGIAGVRQIFDGQSNTIDKHWSGRLNAPENRPFDEGVDRSSHDLVQWTEHPTYDGHLITFEGALLDDAVLANLNPRSGGYQNFNMSAADAHDYVGSILPNLSGSAWTLDDPGDAVAHTYVIDARKRTFAVKFTFPQALGDPAEYVVIVWGFQDGSGARTPRDKPGILAYARIRVE